MTENVRALQNDIHECFLMLRHHRPHRRRFKIKSVLWCDSAEVQVWLCLGTKRTWLGAGTDHDLGSNKYLVKVRETPRFGIQLCAALRHHGYSNTWFWLWNDPVAIKRNFDCHHRNRKQTVYSDVKIWYFIRPRRHPPCVTSWILRPPEDCHLKIKYFLTFAKEIF